MKTWLRGDSWEVQPGHTLNRFPIRSDKFDENELILPFHLTSEGFPSIWGPAHAFSIRLNHSDHRFDEKDAAYQEQCRQAARDLLTMVVAQFLGLLKPDEISLAGSEANSAAESRLLPLVKNNLESESRSMEALIVLRDPRLTGAPIAAINYPDCLWFPVHSYKLDMVGKRIEETLGRIDLTGLVPAQRREEREREGLKALVGQLRAYLRQFLPAGSAVAPYARVLATFENGLSRVAEPGSAPIRSGRAFGLTRGDEADKLKVVEIELRRSGDVTVPVDTGCQECGHDWMNHSYPNGPLELVGGAKPKRNVTCPQHRGQLLGWEDLMSRGVFFDEAESEYVIWADDPADEEGQYLQMPPNGERVEVQRNADGVGYARFRFNRAEILVRGRVVKRREVLLRQVVELPRTATVTALPVNGEEASCVDWNEGGVTEHQSRRGYWDVRLRGGWRPFDWSVETFQDTVISEPDNVTLLLWPGLETPEGSKELPWKAETVVYGVTNILQRNVPKVRCYSSGRRKTRVLGEHDGIDITRSMLHFTERVEALEFRSASNEPIGYLRPKRRIVYKGQLAEAIVALDFGTSNTAIAWMSLEGARAVAMDQDPQPLELLSPTKPEDRESIATTLSLLPFWPKADTPRWCIPSELLHFVESNQWTIPHDSLEPAQLESKEIRISQNFKWLDQGNTLRSTYLGMVLRMALAHLRVKGITSVQLRATYPLAFEYGKLGNYAKILETVCSKLSVETGMQIKVAGYLNESISGLNAAGRLSGNVQCAIDFGGGTTDIAIQVADPQKGFVEPLFVDSLKLAGNDVLDSLLADPVLLDAILQHRKAASTTTSSAQPETRRRIARQIILGELRSSGPGIPPWWRELIQRDEAQLFAMRNRAIFDSVLAYVLKLISVAQETMHHSQALTEGQGAQVDVFLLGQGWGLLNLQVRGETDPRAYVQKRLEELRSSLPFVPQNCEFEVYVPDFEVGRSSPKLATSVGAVKLPQDSPKSAQILEVKTGRKTIFGIDVQFDDGNVLASDMLLDADRSAIKSRVARLGAWDQFAGPLLNAPGVTDHVRQRFGASDTERRKLIESRMKSLIDQNMKDQLANTVALRVSPLSLLLEHVWAEQLKRLE